MGTMVLVLQFRELNDESGNYAADVLPWSGYFGLMSTVDIFVILDDVQFARRSWQQRNQIKTIQGPKWLTRQ